VIRSMLKAGLLLALVLWQQQLAAAQAVGRVVAVSGEASVIRSSDSSRHALAFKDPIFLNDRILTATASQVKLLLNDDSILKVSPTSELLISESLLGPGEQSRTTVNLLKGKLRSLVGKQLGANSRFEVYTDVAVAGVRGTDFEVLAAGESLVRTFSGVVEVGNIDPKIPQTVLLTANMFTRVVMGQPPTPPAYIAPGESLRGKLSQEAGDEGPADAGGGVGPGPMEEEALLVESEIRHLDDEGDEPAGEEGMEPTGEPRLLDEVLEEEIYGDPNNGQVDTVVEPVEHVETIPFDINIPQP